MKYYYHVHIEGRPLGSIRFISKKKLPTEKRHGMILSPTAQIINEALKQRCMDTDDAIFVDTAERIDREEYLKATLGLVAAEKYKVLHTRKANLPLLIGSLKYQQSKDLLEERMKT